MRLFAVSTVRKQHTRALRLMSPTCHRSRQLKQVICGGAIRLVRNRPMALREDLFLQYKDQLADLQSRGAIEVRVGSPQGPVFDFGGAMPAPGELQDDASENEEEAAEAPTNEVGDFGDPGDPGDSKNEEVKEAAQPESTPDMTWTKTALVDYAAQILGESFEDLDKLTKREILARLT